MPNNDDNDGIKLIYEQSDQKLGLLHGPTEIHGIHEGEFVGIVVNEQTRRPLIKWWKNGDIVNEGEGLTLIWPTENGTYHATVHGNDGSQIATSPPYQYTHRYIRHQATTAQREAGPSGFDNNSVDKKRQSDSEMPVPKRLSMEKDLPKIKIEDLDYSRDNEIGVEVAGAIQSIVESEMSIHSSLRHPNIVQFLGLVQTKKSVGMVCEYLPKNLEEVIFGSDSQEQNLDKVDLEDSDKLFITLGCLQGLAYLHAHNVVHADIKPANILVSSDMPVVKLCDMGLSRLKSTACATKTKHSVPGTLMYMAPESVLQNVMPNRSSDIWSMSATSCEVYAGSDFWNIGDGKADKYISTKMSNKKDPDGLCYLRKSYRAVCRLLKKGLQYEPTKRPSAVQLLSDFRNI